ncbi:MAG: FtsX-like permease family protein [Pseudomonadales bacterium]|nr:FtsX-like permease family protein [Pseudomonadales bacterium]
MGIGETTLDTHGGSPARRSVLNTLLLIMSIAWRNLGRNRRRTGLVASAVAFSILLTVFFMSLQTGSYAVMTENATGFLAGHIQIQAKGYAEEARLETTFAGVQELLKQVRELPAVLAVTARAQTYALASVGERSVGVQIMGVNSAAELVLSTLPGFVVEGSYMGLGDPAIKNAQLEGSLSLNGEPLTEQVPAYIGSVLARNLGLALGEELILLGSQKRGGIATLVLVVTGIFSTGQTEVDRALVQIPLPTFQEIFNLHDEAHMLVIKGRDISQVGLLRRELNDKFPGLYVQSWFQLLPEIEQAMALDRISGYFFYGILLVMVVLSVVNTFIMMVFERTKEFGVLLALGMRPWAIVGLLQIEALWLCLLGIALGLVLAAFVVFVLGSIGIPLGDNAELMKAFHMPDRAYPQFSLIANLISPFFMLIFIQLAAFFSSIRVLKMRPALVMR